MHKYQWLEPIVIVKLNLSTTHLVRDTHAWLLQNTKSGECRKYTSAALFTKLSIYHPYISSSKQTQAKWIILQDKIHHVQTCMIRCKMFKCFKSHNHLENRSLRLQTETRMLLWTSFICKCSFNHYLVQTKGCWPTKHAVTYKTFHIQLIYHSQLSRAKSTHRYTCWQKHMSTTRNCTASFIHGSHKLAGRVGLIKGKKTWYDKWFCCLFLPPPQQGKLIHAIIAI